MKLEGKKYSFVGTTNPEEASRLHQISVRRYLNSSEVAQNKYFEAEKFNDLVAYLVYLDNYDANLGYTNAGENFIRENHKIGTGLNWNILEVASATLHFDEASKSKLLLPIIEKYPMVISGARLTRPEVFSAARKALPENEFARRTHYLASVIGYYEDRKGLKPEKFNKFYAKLSKKYLKENHNLVEDFM